MSVFTILYWAAMIIEIMVRYPFQKTAIAAVKTDQRGSQTEKVLISLLTVVMLVIPLIYTVTNWLGFANYHLPAWMGWSGVFVLACSVLVFWRAHVDLKSNWSPTLEIHQDHMLVTNGIYRYIRHPMYASQLLWAIAQILLLQNGLAGPLHLIFFVPFCLLRVQAEEKMMLDTFGDPYRQYMKKTGGIMPKWSIFLTLVFLTAFISGCAPVVTPSPFSPTLPASPVSPILTSSPIPPTFTPEPVSTATLVPPTISPQVSTIKKIRTDLELPDLPLEFIAKTGMLNSPSGGLEVVIYQDSAGRKYSVDPETNRVLEIDARGLLSHISPNAKTFSMDVLKSKAMQYIKAAIPDFEHLQSAWQFEEGGKGDYYFFTWYGGITPGSMNRPFAQIGLDKSGLLFAYYNTLLLNP